VIHLIASILDLRLKYSGIWDATFADRLPVKIGEGFELPAFRVLGDIRKLAVPPGAGFSAVFQNLVLLEVHS
jgi:hypothetical protein